MTFIVKDSGSMEYAPTPKTEALAQTLSTLTYASLARSKEFLDGLGEGIESFEGVVNCLGRVSFDRCIQLGLNGHEAARLLAANDYSRVMKQANSGELLESPDAAAVILIEAIGSKQAEHMAVVIMDVRNRVIATKIVAIGTSNECLCPTREIFRSIIAAGGERFILGHNHPSGSTLPSREDYDMTIMLNDASRTMQIRMLDHLVVTSDRSHSIRGNENQVENWCH